MTVSPPLLRCPFCGSSPTLFGTVFEGYLGCDNQGCLVRPAVFTKGVRAELTLDAAWNHRADGGTQ